MRIAAIVLNVLVLAFVAWMDVASVQFARSVDMSPLAHIGIIAAQWIFVAVTTGPTLLALMRDLPRAESYAIVANLVLWFGLASMLAVLTIALLLPGTDHERAVIPAIPAIVFLVPVTFNVIVLRQRRTIRLHAIAARPKAEPC